MQTLTPNELMTVQTGNYEPVSSSYTQVVRSSRMPRFHLGWVAEMLKNPRVNLGLWMIKGPIQSNAKFHVDCENKKIKDYVAKQFERYWVYSSVYALRCIEYGFALSEAVWKETDGQLHFDSLSPIMPNDSHCMVNKGEIIGASVNCKTLDGKGGKIYLWGMKKLWNVNRRQYDKYYGRSRLYGSFEPFIELWCEGGQRDSRKLFFYKYAWDGGIMYHPPGFTNVTLPGGGSMLYDNQKTAREALEKRRNGGTMTMPNVSDESGKRLWEYIPPQTNSAPAGLLEYGDSLNNEILEGMGIPHELVSADGTGAYAGRSIPKQAFYSSLQDDLNWNVLDFNEQLIRPAVAANFSEKESNEYSVIPFPLLTEEEKAEQQAAPSDMMLPNSGDASNPGNPPPSQ